jgi:histidine triad (HIT) family protein
VFCRIVARTTHADVEYEDDLVMAFKDIYPKAPIHLLIVPKRHISSITTMEPVFSPLARSARPGDWPSAATGCA